MHRIDTPTAQKDKFGAGKNGFTRGNPQTGTPATDLDDDYFDAIQEELATVIEAAGLTLDKSKHNQLLEALLRVGAGAPAIGVPFFWPSASMPNTVMPEWANMVFLKFNGATFSATTYPKLALVIPSLTLTEARGEFPRIWDDGRGVDSGRTLLSAQSSAAPEISGELDSSVRRSTDGALIGSLGNLTGSFAGVGGTLPVGLIASTDATLQRYVKADFKASRSSNIYQAVSEVRSRNIAFNFLVRAK